MGKQLPKEIRVEVWGKYGCKCAYCGIDLEYKKMQVDHIKPLYRNDNVKTLEVWGVERGGNDIDNLNPSCARCNRWKSTYSLEQFREEISKQCERLKRDSSQYRMAIDYGLIKETDNKIVFWFEEFKKL